MTALAAWQNFYMITGSSAGALIGLQFVVLSLIVNRPSLRVDPQAGRAFSTPTIIHFSTVLTLAAILAAPWEGLRTPTVLCGAVGMAGIAYISGVTWRLRRQTDYQLEFEDWLFYTLLPYAAYGTLVASAYAVRSHARAALFGVGAAVLLLLFIGIHNAWDTILYHVFVRKPE